MARAGDVSDHENAAQEVVAVDAEDRRQGVVNRLDAHTGDGIRHRAFTALLFDEQGRILLAQRSPNKRLWDAHWDGTVASHPRDGETQAEAARQRLDEELGVTPDQYGELAETDRFEYRRRYYDEGLEHEVCAVLRATLRDTRLDPNTSEVAGVLWVPYERLVRNRRWYRQLRLCPWFEIAIQRDSN